MSVRSLVGVCLLVGAFALACSGEQRRDPGVGELQISEEQLVSALAGAPRKIRVFVCDPSAGGGSCLPCDDETVKGLELRGPNGEDDRRVRVRCESKVGGVCVDRRAEIRWQFKQLDNSLEHRGHVAGEDKGSGGDPSVYQPRDETSDGNFTVESGPAVYPGNSAVWPYRIDLFQVEDGEERLLACADPEILVDP